MSSDKIIEIVQGNIFILRFNKTEKKNALDSEMFVHITKALNFAATNKNISMVVLTGTGDFYSSGFDLSSERSDCLYKVLEEFIKSFITFPKLLIAIVNGPAIGIAATTLALCDYVIASEDAYFYTPFTKLGAAAEGCSSVTFPKLLGERKATDMLLLNYKMPAAEALQCGFVNKIYTYRDLHKKSWETIKEISDLSQHSVVYTKSLMKRVSKEELLKTNEVEMLTLRKLNDIGKSKL